METFHTGERAPSTRMYTFVGHMESSTCGLRQDEKDIPLYAGETFPPCVNCDTDAFWVK
jgi:hypothetical protein